MLLCVFLAHGLPVDKL